MKGYHQFNNCTRIKLEALRRAGLSVKEIADELSVNRSSVYRELKRGEYEHTKSDLTIEKRYSSDLAQQSAEENLKNKGPRLKIGKDHRLANYIEKKICDENYTPESVIDLIARKGLKFSVSLTKPTIYSYIDKGVFLRLTNDYLPVKGKRSQRKKQEKRQKRASAGRSIEQRPKEILCRECFGHWEMDTVVGVKGVTKSALLVLTERKTRAEIIIKMPSREAYNVVKSLDKLELKFGTKIFKKLFKTITVDNGVEFSRVYELEGSVHGRNIKRTNLYYCHAYASYERGSNERMNRMIRRKIPKGYDFEKMTEEEIKEVEDWVNTYPRRIFWYKTSQELFDEELKNLSSA